MIDSTEVSWDLDGIRMYGTFTRPAGQGPFPAVVLVAGSGPTDRDWCSPLLPGTNGSGRLFAEAFARAGIAALRYDKRASGPHVALNLPSLVGKLRMASHLEELAAAIAVLADQEGVDRERLVGMGNSEGTLHVLNYALSAQPIPLAGLVLAAPPGRAVGDVLLSQLALQASMLPNGDELMDLVRASVARYTAGGAMDPDPELPEAVRMTLLSFDAPANLPLARELWSADATSLISDVDIPTLVLIGGHDLQVDQHADGDPMQAAAEGKANVTFAFPPTANHVFKEDTRTAAEVMAAPGNGYNTDETRLDPEALATILGFLKSLFRQPHPQD